MSSVRSRQMSGSSVSSLINPVNGYRDTLRRKGVEPRNHAKENIANMRRKQAVNREAKESEARRGEQKFVMKRFRNVESRVERDRKESDTARGTGREFLKKTDRAPSTARSSKPFIRPDAGSNKQAVPRSQEVNRLAERSNENFVSRNRKGAQETQLKPEAAAATSPKGGKALHEDFGKMPNYLLKRRQEWDEEEDVRQANMPDKDCPPGMSLMPEGERLETLAVLTRSQETAKDTLRRMPLVIETQGQVRRKNELDAKLKEIEDAIVIFSREKVYVAD